MKMTVMIIMVDQQENRLFPAPKDFSAKAHVKSREEYERMYRESIENPEAFWGKAAAEKRSSTIAARANVNLLRVWGGGLIESHEFYDLCDRLGILVWQEFIQSSSGIESVPSDDPEFVATMASDAREIVPRLRRHPSLAVWCGGNELDGDDTTPVLAALRDVVRELDPERA